MNLRLRTSSSDVAPLIEDGLGASISFGPLEKTNELSVTPLLASKRILVGLPSTIQALEETGEITAALYVDSQKRSDDWSVWCNANQRTEPSNDRRIHSSTSAQALEAASAGMGVLVTEWIFVKELLSLNHFATFGETCQESNLGFSLYCHTAVTDNEAITALRTWLLELSN